MSSPATQEPKNEVEAPSQEQQQMSEESQMAIFEVFKQFDKDSSGSIDYAEVKALAQELGEDINATEVEAIFKDLDVNKDGKITFDEFWIWWASGRPNKLQKLVYFKLKSMKLLKSAHADFIRMGGSLDSKYDRTRDNHYIAVNYGESKGDLRVNLLYSSQDDELPGLLKKAKEGVPNSDEADNSLRIFVRLKSKDPKKTVEEFKLLQAQFKERLFAVIPAPGKAFYNNMDIQAHVVESECVISMILPFKELIREIEGEELKILENFNDASEAKLEITLGLKHSLDHLMDHLDDKFVKWLLSGFLIEGKLTMGRGALGFFRKALQKQFSKEKDEYMKDIYKQKLREIALLSLLCGSKFHLVFQDIDDIDAFFEGLGLKELTQDQPSVKDLLTEIAYESQFYELRDAPKPENLQKAPKDVFWRAIQFAMENIESEMSIQILHQKGFFDLQIFAPGAGKLVDFLATKPPEEPYEEEQEVVRENPDLD